MNGSTSGPEGKKKAYSAKIHARAPSSEGCSFCWFVLAVYPTMEGMTPRDNRTFREHLMKAHGLREDIST